MGHQICVSPICGYTSGHVVAIVLSVSFPASTHFRSASYVACFPDSRSKVPECTDVPVCTTIEFLILTVSWEVKGSSILHGSSGTKVGGARSTRWV